LVGNDDDDIAIILIWGWWIFITLNGDAA
jgi:hypothetical protein